MTDRIVIEFTGDLPDANKYAILAAAQTAADLMAKELSQEHKVALNVSVRAVRPGKTGAKPRALRPAAE